MTKLNFGCGSCKLAGWVNVDIDPANQPEVVSDLRAARLPWTDESVGFIHMEHFFEHIPKEAGQRLLGECRRMLRPGGVVRISGPDLQKIAALYLSGDVELWRSRSNAPCETITDFMNDVFYGWGHCYIPDPPQLRLMLQRAGFSFIEVWPYGQSRYADLCNIEVRGASQNEDFVIEGVK